MGTGKYAAKKQIKISGKNLNEMEISNLPDDKEFKVTVIKMLPELKSGRTQKI